MKPTALEVKPENIPAALKTEHRWVCWRYEQRQGEDRWAKILYNPTIYRRAKSNDPSTWATFENALAQYRSPRSVGSQLGSPFDGIGFCLGDGWAGIDFDNCWPGRVRTQNQYPVENAQGALQRMVDLGVYFEDTPGGVGARAIGRSTRMGGEIKYEITPPAKTTWNGARFVAVTGLGFGDPLVDLTAVIDEWFPSVPRRSNAADRPAFIHEGDTRGTERIERRTDDEALLAAATAANRIKFLKLFRGDMTDYGNDHSRADQALVNMLVFWSCGDLDQVDRLFRQSNLMRDKWNVSSYRTATLQKAAALYSDMVL